MFKLVLYASGEGVEVQKVPVSTSAARTSAADLEASAPMEPSPVQSPGNEEV